MTGTKEPHGRTDTVGAETSPSARRRRRWPWVTLGGLVVVLAGLYVAAYALIGDRVPSGTRVAGVDIGGLDPDEARSKLTKQLAGRAARPVTFQYGGEAYNVDPATAGLSFDAEQTVLNAGGGRSWNPIRMIDVLAGPESSVTPVTRADDEAVDAAVAAIADKVDTPASEGAIRLRGVRPVIRQPVVGKEVDRAAAGAAVKQAYFRTATGVDLPVDEQQPTMTGSELRDFVDAHVRAIVSRPIRLALPGQTLPLPPRQFAPALGWKVEGGSLSLSVDEAVLGRNARPTLARIDAKPRNASLVLRDGRPVVIPARPGVTVRPSEIAGAVRKVAQDPSQRRIQVGTSVARADVTTGDLRRLGVKEVGE